MRSTCGWPGTSRTFRSSATPMMRFATVVLKTRPTACEGRLRRFAECGLTLHPEKTKIVYCKDQSRRDNHPIFRFDFLGYTFRPRQAGGARKTGTFVGFNPGMSSKSAVAIRREMRSWQLHLRSDLTLEELARRVNPSLGVVLTTTECTSDRH